MGYERGVRYIATRSRCSMYTHTELITQEEENLSRNIGRLGSNNEAMVVGR